MKAELVLGNLKRERDALNNKLERIANALNKEWQDADQEYLCTQQYNAMQLYAHILDERIIDIEYKLKKRKANSKEQMSDNAFEDTSIFKKNVDFKSYEKNIENKQSDKESIHNYKVYQSLGELMKDIFGIDVFCDDSE